MEENFKLLSSDIIDATANIEGLQVQLSKITGPTVFIGSGGSKVVAEFAAKVLSKKNNIISIVLDASDMSSYPLDNFANIFIASSGGKNYGVKNSFLGNKNMYLLSARKTNIAHETLLTYYLGDHSSFISLNQTIVPMAVLLKYYLGDDFDEIIGIILKSIDATKMVELHKLTNIFSNYQTVSSSTFLESTLVESGMSIPVVHQKYDYCHGRSTLNKERTSTSILLTSNESDLDKVLEEVLTSSKTHLIKLKGIFKDEIVNDFFLTLQSMYLLKNVAASKGVDLAKINYDRNAVKKLYYFKGSM